MDTHRIRAIRSVLIIFAGLALYVASFWVPGTQSASIPHRQQSGYIDDGTNSSTRYFVLMIRNKSEAPWLIVSQPFHQQSEITPFTTEMSSTTNVVTVDGVAYEEVEGQTVVVLRTPDRRLTHKIPSDQSATLALLGRRMADVRVGDFETLLPADRSGEPSDATERRNRAF